jgi:anthranilate synthase/indole-3-glycerol phosphate synthase/phosphoribosylanthranilate isomerase
LEEVLELQRRYKLDVVQLHGSEPVEWASLIPVPVIHKFVPGQPGLGARGYHVVPLLDSGSGDGKLLDSVGVKATLEQDREVRVLLAGGLHAGNVKEAVEAVGDDGGRVVGVDVSSGVETDGVQDLEKIRMFVREAKKIR